MEDTLPPIKRFFDQSFLGKEDQLKVEIQFCRQYLSIAYFYSSHNQYVGYEDYHLGKNENWEQAYPKLNNILKQIQLQYHDIRIGIIDDYYSIIPTPLFSHENIADYLNLNHSTKSKDFSFHYNSVESINSTIAYAVPLQLNQLIQNQLTSYQLIHYTVPLLEYSNLQQKAKEAEMQLHVQHNHFEVIYYEHQKLQFFNRFEYQTAEDLIYFLLYVMEQLKIDREKVEIQLYGEIDQSSSTYRILFQYIRHLHLLERPKELNFSTVLSKLPMQYHRNLFNQYLCE